MSQSMFEFHGIKSNFEFCTMALFEFFPALSLQNTASNSISVCSKNNAYLNIYLYMINSKKYASNKKTQVLGYKHARFRGSVGMGKWGIHGDSHRILLWVWDGCGD